MNKSELVKLIWKKIYSVLLEVRANENENGKDSRYIVFHERTSNLGKRSIVKINTFENFKNLRYILDKILSEKNISKKYSEKYIDNKIIDLLHDVIKLNDELAFKKLDELISEFFNSIAKEYILISKLENIEISEDLEYKLLNSTIKIFHKSESDVYNEYHEKQISNIHNKPIIFTKISAVDSNKINELALINFETTFTFIKLIYPNFDIKLTGTMQSGRRDFLIIKEWTMKSISSNVEWIGDSRVNEAKLNSLIYTKLTNLGFENISETQQKYLKDCLYWYGEGLNTENVSSKIINYVTILESMLKLKDEKTELSKSISERGAIMLNNNFEYRLLIKNELKEIYNIRSDIVHTGELKNNKNISVMAGAYARQVILKYIELAQKYKTHEKLIEYLDKTKLGFIEDQL